MYQALMEQLTMPDIDSLSLDERLGLLVDREMTARDSKRLKTRLYKAKLRQASCIEDINDRHPRGLDKALMTRLGTCQWVRERHNVLIPGPTGIGKTWLACALGHKACREGWSALYLRLPRLLQELPIAKGDGRDVKLMASLAKTDVLILDDWALAPLSDDNRRDLLELLEDRHDQRATIVTSQLPVEHWHEAIGNATLAEAILDRLVHTAYKITLTGDSMRKRMATQHPGLPQASGDPRGGEAASRASLLRGSLAKEYRMPLANKTTATITRLCGKCGRPLVPVYRAPMPMRAANNAIPMPRRPSCPKTMNNATGRPALLPRWRQQRSYLSTARLLAAWALQVQDVLPGRPSFLGTSEEPTPPESGGHKARDHPPDLGLFLSDLDPKRPTLWGHSPPADTHAARDRICVVAPPDLSEPPASRTGEDSTHPRR